LSLAACRGFLQSAVSSFVARRSLQSAVLSLAACRGFLLLAAVQNLPPLLAAVFNRNRCLTLLDTVRNRSLSLLAAVRNRSTLPLFFVNKAGSHLEAQRSRTLMRQRSRTLMRNEVAL
jgi:hypothetical protein